MNQPDSSKRRAGWAFAIIGAGGVVRVVLETVVVAAGVSQARTGLLEMVIINGLLNLRHPMDSGESGAASACWPQAPHRVRASVRLVLAEGVVTIRDLLEQLEAVGGRPS